MTTPLGIVIYSMCSNYIFLSSWLAFFGSQSFSALPIVVVCWFYRKLLWSPRKLRIGPYLVLLRYLEDSENLVCFWLLFCESIMIFPNYAFGNYFILLLLYYLYSILGSSNSSYIVSFVFNFCPSSLLLCCSAVLQNIFWIDQ